MTQIKYNIGIDLGTTNSAIARILNGSPIIQKTDSLNDTMPSVVGYNEKKSEIVGNRAWNQLKSDRLRALRTMNNKDSNYFSEFKRTIGTDKPYESNNLIKSLNSEELSSKVLQKLLSFITDVNINSAIITVPAKFDIKQKQATLRAGKMSGLEYCELLQEPIAASMAYGLQSKVRDGYWIVFDFGGGTFDVALIKVEEGIMQVKDTDGDNHLGGKNIDFAIVDEIIIPYLASVYNIKSITSSSDKLNVLQSAMKYFAEEAKIQLTFSESHDLLTDLGEIPLEDDDGKEVLLDLTITRADLKKVITPLYQKAIDVTKNLLIRNNLRSKQIDSLILVGGPTLSPILREMLEEQVMKPDITVDPMTVVAVGAALYASTIDLPKDALEAARDNTKIQLDIGYDSSTVETESWITVKILKGKTEGVLPESVFVELVRSDGDWASGKVEINETGEIIEVSLKENKPNNFNVHLYDKTGNKLDSQPDSFSIIQGSVTGSATLPHAIGLEIKDRKTGELLFNTIEGLRINQMLPATGTINGLKTQRTIRPGISSDFIRIPLYQGDHDSENTRAIYNHHIYDAIITGNELPGLLPEGSDVDLIIKTDKSGNISKLEAYFPYLDFSMELDIPEDTSKEVTADHIQIELNKAYTEISELKRKSLANDAELETIKKEIDYLNSRFEQGKTDYDRKNEVLTNLKKTFRQIDKLNESIAWPKIEEQLRNELKKLEQAQLDVGTEKTEQAVKDIRIQVQEVIRSKDKDMGKSLLEVLDHAFFLITFLYQQIGFIRYHSENFNSFNWKDSFRARKILNEAEQIISVNPTTDRLRPLIGELIQLLPIEERRDEYKDVLMRN